MVSALGVSTKMVQTKRKSFHLVGRFGGVAISCSGSGYYKLTVLFGAWLSVVVGVAIINY